MKERNYEQPILYLNRPSATSTPEISPRRKLENPGGRSSEEFHLDIRQRQKRRVHSAQILQTTRNNLAIHQPQDVPPAAERSPTNPSQSVLAGLPSALQFRKRALQANKSTSETANHEHFWNWMSRLGLAPASFLCKSAPVPQILACWSK